MCDILGLQTIFCRHDLVAINTNNLSRLNFFVSSGATVFVVTYANGSTEAFTVPTNSIEFVESLDVDDFCKEIKKAQKEREKQEKEEDKDKD